MIRGITPIDGAFELMGLHQAQVWVRFIFLETLAGKVIFALGFLLSIKAGLDKGNFRPAFIFIMVFFSLWFLLVLPRSKAVDPVSAMERSGYQEITIAQILKKNGYGEVMVNPVLDAMSRTVDALITAVAAVFERGSDGRGYLASPFLFMKVSILTSGIVAQGITDPDLQERTVHFYQDHFWPVLRQLKNPGTRVWPGDPDMVRAYKEEGRVAWQALRDALYQACDEQKIFTNMFDRFYDKKVDKDAVVRSLLWREMELKPLQYTFVTYGSGLEHRREDGSGWLDFYRIDLARMTVFVLPFFQGSALFILWSLFPGFLAVTLLLRKVTVLIVWMGLIFLVKAWTLIWVILDKLSTVWFSIQ